MRHEEVRARLDDYLDDSLSPTDRAAIEGHLRECEACRAEAAALAELLTEAGRLPRELVPPKDLWPAIDRRLEEPRRILPRRWIPMAAAAAVLVATITTVTVVRMTRPTGPTGAGPSGPVAGRSWAATESEYRAAVSELREALSAVGNDLAPETRNRVNRSLRVVDAAIEEMRAALARDPNDPALEQLLRAAYQKKLEVLRQATDLAAET